MGLPVYFKQKNSSMETGELFSLLGDAYVDALSTGNDDDGRKSFLSLPLLPKRFLVCRQMKTSSKIGGTQRK